MDIQIIEPHGDDAFISCSSALINPSLSIDILTLSDRSSEGLKSYYPSVKSATFIDTPDIHYDYHLKFKTHEVHKQYLNNLPLYGAYECSMEYMLDSTEGDSAGEKYVAFKNGLYTSYLHDPDLLNLNRLSLLPVGLFHPNHYATRRVIEEILYPETPRIYYVDKPYIEKRYMKEIISKSNFLFYTAPVQDQKTRAKIFKDIYPTEQSLLRFSSQTILEWKDIYAVRPQDKYNPDIIEFLATISDMKEGDKFENLILHASQD